MEDKGCGEYLFYDTLKDKAINCGASKLSDGSELLLCDGCKVKNLGVIIDSKWYEIQYFNGNRTLTQYTILKINKQSVRMKAEYIKGSNQLPSTFTITNDSVLRRFSNFSKGLDEEIGKKIFAITEALKDLDEELKDIPKRKKLLRNELKDLNRGVDGWK